MTRSPDHDVFVAMTAGDGSARLIRLQFIDSSFLSALELIHYRATWRGTIMIETQIEIAAPPSKVREIVRTALLFPSTFL